MDEVTKFLAHPTTVGVLALALLGVWYVLNLSIDFYKSTILPGVYERRLMRRALSLPTASKVLDSDWTSSAYFRDGNPKLIDFKNGTIFPRPELSIARTTLQKSRFLHIQGPPSSGKTVIALNLAYEFSQAKRPVLYFGRPSLLNDAVLSFFATPESMRQLDRRFALVIVDDVHLDTARASRLFSLVYTNYEKLSLIFISRPLRVEATDPEVLSTFNFPSYMQSLGVTAEATITALANYYSEKKFSAAIPPAVLRALIEECGTDLLLLGRYLREWQGTSFVHLPDIRRKVFQTVRADLETLRARSPDAVSALLVISLFYRNELQVERRFLESTLHLNVEPLLVAGDVIEQNRFLLLHHSSMAKLYANVFRTLNLPEFAAMRSAFSPLPQSLFAAYVRSDPRNVCETLIAVRKAKEIVPFILCDASLHGSLQRAFESERDLNLLGWAMLCLHSADKRLAWKVLSPVSMIGAGTEASLTATPDDLRLFIFNMARVSRVKGAEWLDQMPVNLLADVIQSLNLRQAAETLQNIRDFSRERFHMLLSVLDPTRVCEMVLHENDMQALRDGLAILGRLCQDRICIRAYASPDAFGETVTRLSFYFETKRVVRFLKRHTRGMPFGTSPAHKRAYLGRLLLKDGHAGAICVDDGAFAALGKRRSLFPVGVRRVDGTFERDSIVDIVNLEGERVGVGVSNFTSDELRRVAGMRSEEIKAVNGVAANRVMDNDLIVVGKRFDALREGQRATPAGN
jgi:hypothetical protein